MTTFTDIFVANGTPNQEQIIRANDTARTAALNNAIGASGALSIASLTCSGDVTANSFIGNGAQLTGITGATGGISNPVNTNIVADSDNNGSGVIALSIYTTDGLVLNNDASVTVGFGPLGVTKADANITIANDGLDSNAAIRMRRNVTTATTFEIQAGNANNLGSVRPLALNPNGGPVGVGTATPNIAGGSGQYLTIEGSTDFGTVLELSNKSDNLIANGSVGQVDFYAGASTQTRVSGIGSNVVDTNEDSGYFFVKTKESGGAYTENFRVDHDGGIYAYNLLAEAASTDLNVNGSNEIHSVTSSLRYKENVRDYDLDISKIMDMQPALYEFREEYGGATEYGFPAEWLDEVFPEFVYKKRLLLEAEEVDENGDVAKEAVYSDFVPDSVQYSRLGSVIAIPVLQKIIQQLTAQGLFTFD